MKYRKIKRGIWIVILTVMLCSIVEIFPTSFTAHRVQAAAKPASALTVLCGDTVSMAVNGGVKYTSSNKKVATVSSKGVVTGVKEGKATITTKTKNKTYKTKVTVKKQKSVIQVKNKSLTVETGGKIAINATSAVKLSYKAKNSNIKVDTKGNITGVKTGSTTVVISGKATKIYAAPKSISIKVTVTDPVIHVTYGKTGSVKTKNATKYTSSNSNVVKVNTKGTLTPVKSGTATVSVKVGKTTKKYKIVVDKAESTITLPNTAVEVRVNNTLELKATGKVALQYKASSDVVSVDAKGVITGKKEGTANITISGKATSCYLAPKSVTVKVTVKPALQMPSTDPESSMEVYTGEKSPEAFLQVCKNVATTIVNDGNWIYSNYNNSRTFTLARKNSRVTNCAHYVSMCMQQFGTLPQGYMFYSDDNATLIYKPYNSNAEKVFAEMVNKYYTVIKPGGKKASELDLQPGDIVCYKGHVNVYAGKNSKGTMTWYDFASSGTSDKQKDSGPFVRILRESNIQKPVYTIFRLKEQ